MKCQPPSTNDLSADGTGLGCRIQARLYKEMKTTRTWPYMGPFLPRLEEQTRNPGLRSRHIWKDTGEGVKKIYNAQPNSLPLSPARGENYNLVGGWGTDKWHPSVGGRSCLSRWSKKHLHLTVFSQTCGTDKVRRQESAKPSESWKANVSSPRHRASVFSEEGDVWWLRTRTHQLRHQRQVIALSEPPSPRP